MKNIIEKLKGGDFRSIGNSNEVVEEVLNNPVLFDAVFKAMLNEDPLVRMRAADAVEKITRDYPEYLQPYKTDLVKNVAAVNQQEVRWHTAQMIPRLILTKEERTTSAEILFRYLEDDSKIVQTNALQALADLSTGDVVFRQKVFQVVEKLTKTGSPAVKNRALKLLEEMESH
jgi:hypothetical protein